MFLSVSAAAALGSRLDTAFFSFDLSVFRFFGEHQSDFATGLAHFVTNLGDPLFMTPVCALGLILIFFKRSRKYGIVLFTSILLGLLFANGILKHLFTRVRPYNTLQHIGDYWQWYRGVNMPTESDYSFPSGHVVAAFEVALTMFVYLWQEKKKLLALLFPIAAVGVACSRIYLMIHYPSDVLFGALLGIFCALLSLWIARIAEQKQFLAGFDLEQKLRKPLTKGKFVGVCLVFLAVCFAGSYGKARYELTSDPPRCDYNEAYDCQNLAKTDPADDPDGLRYCKIHTP